MHLNSDCDGLDMVVKITRLSNQPNWFHPKIHPESTGIVETSQDRKQWQYVLKHLVPYQIGRYGQLMEWSTDIDDPKDEHRHNSLALTTKLWL